MAPFLPLNPKTLGAVPVPFGTSFFAIMGARSLNRLPSNLPRSHEDTIFYSAEAAWTVYFCSQGVNLRPAPQPFGNSFIGRTALPGACFADYFPLPASVKLTLSLTKSRGGT